MRSAAHTQVQTESWEDVLPWGAVSDGSSSGERPGDPNHKHKIPSFAPKQQSLALRAPATPPRRIRRKPLTIPKERKNRSLWKRLNQERHYMGESLTQRFRLCFQGQAQHKRTESS